MVTASSLGMDSLISEDCLDILERMRLLLPTAISNYSPIMKSSVLKSKKFNSSYYILYIGLSKI